MGRLCTLGASLDMARLFFAVWPPDEVVDELTALRRKDQRGVRFVRPENWHITLRFLGEAEPGRVIDAMDRWRCAPARVILGPAVDVLADRMLVIPAAGLETVADEVTKRTRAIGEPPRRRFVGSPDDRPVQAGRAAAEHARRPLRRRVRRRGDRARAEPPRAGRRPIRNARDLAARNTAARWPRGSSRGGTSGG